METVDNRSSLYELDEIFKYKNLIDASVTQIIKEIICIESEIAEGYYVQFIKLVSQEVDHQLNKTQFTELKDKLINEMRQHLESEKA
ncbi:MAG: hypothetical protein JKY53_08945 [Flavobacteriales bacterium]|nr:hypothetical protein [Flavobacteriales bacterium]